ncbi:MAG TPA: hypothetical protein VGW36_00990 [Pyrinomonadaceae bacterium]|nr:hypothetical protein [Pyrinomonadaceae bacterium]
MAEERNLGLARAREIDGEDATKEALQRRMDEARDSISNTVSEIKENVTQQYESVKDALDWREHFKRQPVAWTIGAAGVGFLVGYGLAAALTDDDSPDRSYSTSTPTEHAYAASPVLREPASIASAITTNGKDDGPGVFARFKETSAYERLSQEAGTIGDRVLEELSTTAQQVVLPALLKKIKNWIGMDLSARTPSMSSSHSLNEVREPEVREPSVQSREF